MKNFKTFLAVVSGVMILTACNEGGDEAPAPANLITANDSFSYFYGVLLHTQFASVDLEYSPEMVAAGMRETGNGTGAVDEQTAQAAVSKVIREAQLAKRAANPEPQRPGQDPAQAAKNLQDGIAFLANNATQDGVKTTESGLQYKVVNEGTGAKPGATDKVKVHYEGKLIDGKKFDSSYDRGDPIEFPLNGVIRGWTEGLQLMTEGSTYMLYIPSALGYGPNGPPNIGPNQVLVFKVELIQVTAQ